MIVHDEIRYTINPTNTANAMTFRKISNGRNFQVQFRPIRQFNHPLSILTTENFPLSFNKIGNT